MYHQLRFIKISVSHYLFFKLSVLSCFCAKMSDFSSDDSVADPSFVPHVSNKRKASEVDEENEEDTSRKRKATELPKILKEPFFNNVQMVIIL